MRQQALIEAQRMQDIRALEQQKMLSQAEEAKYARERGGKYQDLIGKGAAMQQFQTGNTPIPFNDLYLKGLTAENSGQFSGADVNKLLSEQALGQIPFGRRIGETEAGATIGRNLAETQTSAQRQIDAQIATSLAHERAKNQMRIDAAKAQGLEVANRYQPVGAGGTVVTNPKTGDPDAVIAPKTNITYIDDGNGGKIPIPSGTSIGYTPLTLDLPGRVNPNAPASGIPNMPFDQDLEDFYNARNLSKRAALVEEKKKLEEPKAEPKSIPWRELFSFPSAGDYFAPPPTRTPSETPIQEGGTFSDSGYSGGVETPTRQRLSYKGGRGAELLTAPRKSSPKSSKPLLTKSAAAPAMAALLTAGIPYNAPASAEAAPTNMTYQAAAPQNPFVSVPANPYLQTIPGAPQQAFVETQTPSIAPLLYPGYSGQLLTGRAGYPMSNYQLNLPSQTAPITYTTPAPVRPYIEPEGLLRAQPDSIQNPTTSQMPTRGPSIYDLWRMMNNGKSILSQ